jgi:hypothetical protein
LAPANAAAPVENLANSSSPAASVPAPAYALAANGLGSGFDFGLPQAQALERASAAFGSPGPREHLDCPQGAMDAVKFGHLQLLFDAGRFAGWTIDGDAPRLQTANGVGVGTQRSALGNVEVSEERGFPEFTLGEISGVLDDAGARVVALSAGDSCQMD